MDIENFFWECPNCHTKVKALKQLVDSCFDEDGEAEFMVENGHGLYFHIISCPECEATWLMSISGMELN